MNLSSVSLLEHTTNSFNSNNNDMTMTSPTTTEGPASFLSCTTTQLIIANNNISLVDHKDDDNNNSIQTTDVHEKHLLLKLFVGLVCGLLSFIGLPSSILLVYTISTCKQMRTFQNAFVASLSLRDMFIMGWTVPVFYSVFVLGYYPFGESVCFMGVTMTFSLNVGTCMEFVNIAVSRYVKICCNLNTYKYVYTKRNTMLLISLSWGMSFLCGVPVTLEHFRLNDDNLCFIEKSASKAVVSSIVLVSALAMTSFCYFRIWLTVHTAKVNLRRFNEGPTRQKRVQQNFQTSLRDFMVFVIYFFLLLPFVLLNSFGLSSPNYLAWDLAKLLTFTNNFTNCFIYGVLNKQIRTSLFRLLPCWRKNKQSNNVVYPFTITITNTPTPRCYLTNVPQDNAMRVVNGHPNTTQMKSAHTTIVLPWRGPNSTSM